MTDAKFSDFFGYKITEEVYKSNSFVNKFSILWMTKLSEANSKTLTWAKVLLSHNSRGQYKRPTCMLHDKTLLFFFRPVRY